MITLSQKNRYMRHQVAIFKDWLETYKPTEENLKCGQDSPMFEDSCKFSGLYHSIWEFTRTLENMIKYNEIIIQSEKKELE